MADFTVKMVDESGEHEVHDNPGADRPEIDSWDAAIRAAWVRLGGLSDGWDSAIVIGPHGRVVHLYGADKKDYYLKISERFNREQSAYEAEIKADPSRLTPLFDDEA